MNSWKVYVGGAIYLVVTEYCLETFPSWDPHLVDITGTSSVTHHLYQQIDFVV